MLDKHQTKASEKKDGAFYVSAPAGSGKTKTSLHRIQNLIDSGVPSKRILFVTFSKKASVEMKERLDEMIGEDNKVFVATLHKLCFALYKKLTKRNYIVLDQYHQSKMIKEIVKEFRIEKKFTGSIMHWIEKLKSNSIVWQDKHQIIELMSNGTLGLDDYYENPLISAVIDAYQSYENKKDKTKPYPSVDFIDMMFKLNNLLNANEFMVEYISKIWDYVIVDEFQDTSNLQFEVIKKIISGHGNVYVIGDANQCVLPDTIIGDNLRACEIKVGENISVGYGNGKIGTGVVDKIHKRYIQNEDIYIIETYSGNILKLTGNHKLFAEYISEDKPEELYFTYLMFKKNVGFRVGVTSMYRTREKNNTVIGFKLRLSQEGGDKLWILHTSITKSEAQYYEQYVSVKYGIPTWIFFVEKRYKRLNPNSNYNDNQILKLFENIDTKNNVKKIFEDYKLCFDIAHYYPQSSTKNRRMNFTINMCSGKKSEHRYSINGSNKNDEFKINKLGYKTRNAKGRRGFRLESSMIDISLIYDKYEKISSVMDINLIERGKFSKGKSLLLIPSTYLKKEMSVFIQKNGSIVKDKIKSISLEKYTGTVFDFDIDNYHNYLANGIIVHNSIYGWRGANSEYMSNFPLYLGSEAEKIRLMYTYRCADKIAKLGNMLVDKEDHAISATGLSGNIELHTNLCDEIHEADFVADKIKSEFSNDKIKILYRTNAQSMALEFTLASYGIPYKLIGQQQFFNRKEVKDLLSYIYIIHNKPSELCDEWRRILNRPNRYLGKAFVSKLDSMNNSMSILKALKSMQFGVNYMNKGAFDLAYLIENAPNTYNAKDLLGYILNVTNYREWICGDSSKQENDQSSSDEVINEVLVLAEKMGSIEKLMNMMKSNTNPKAKVELMTIHKSKGLEADTVFIIGVNKNVLPHQLSEDINEEKNLLYVAITRARNNLIITSTDMYANKRTTLSKFIQEIQGEEFDAIVKIHNQ